MAQMAKALTIMRESPRRRLKIVYLGMGLGSQHFKGQRLGIAKRVTLWAQKLKGCDEEIGRFNGVFLEGAVMDGVTTGVWCLIARAQAFWACSAEHVRFLKINGGNAMFHPPLDYLEYVIHLCAVFVVKSYFSLADNIKCQALRTSRPVIEYRAWESHFW